MTGILRPYQRESIRWLRRRLKKTHAAIVAHPPGLGKTAIACRVLKAPALIVCPASVALHWRREISGWRPDLVGDLASGRVRVVSYSTLAARRREFDAETPSVLILDEAHYVKNPESMRTRVACRLVKRVIKSGGDVVALTGTPVPNRPVELWPLLFSLGVTRMSYADFTRRYCGAWMNQWNQLDVSGATNLPELRKKLHPHCLRYEKRDVLSELPPIQWTVVALDLPLDRREKQLKKELLKRSSVPIVRESISDLLHQHGLRKVRLAADYVISILNSDPAQKVLVFAHHRDVISELRDHLVDYGVVTMTGGDSQAKRGRVVDEFQDPDSEVRIFLGQVQAAGVGITLTAATHVVFVEASWVPAVLEQAADRAHRIGTVGSVFADVLTIHESIDEHVLRRVLEKRDVVEKIISARVFTSSPPDSKILKRFQIDLNRGVDE